MDGTLVQQVQGGTPPPQWISRLRWQSHNLYTAGGVVVCILCGHMATCHRKGALSRACAAVIPRGSEYRGDQLLRGSLALLPARLWSVGRTERASLSRNQCGV